METICIETKQRTYDIRIGSGILDQTGPWLRQLFPSCPSALIITDDAVAPLWGEQVKSSVQQAGIPVWEHIFPNGENSKTLSTVTGMLEHMEQLELLFPEESWRADPAEPESAPFVHYRRITEIASLLSVAARYISEAGLHNRMQAELHQKRMELMQQRQVQLETERLLSQAEFKALQSQINPHFLFNTLGAISQLAIVDGSERTADAIFSLSALFRRSLNSRDASPQLRDELAGIDEYLNIKRLLYRDRIRYVRDVDPACLSLRVPLFTLQPIVENALLHGLEPKPEGGTLTLSIRQERGFVVIRVQDDGCGCDAETAERIRQGKTNAGRSDLTGIGMRNVIGRLTSHFGPQFHWSFESMPGQGTCVTLCLPMQPEVAE